jgi:hypothetical protein
LRQSGLYCRQSSYSIQTYPVHSKDSYSVPFNFLLDKLSSSTL